MNVVSPVMANVWKVLVLEAQSVDAGEPLMVLESMKMEIPIEASAAGQVRLFVIEGDVVDEGAMLAIIETT